MTSPFSARAGCWLRLVLVAFSQPPLLAEGWLRIAATKARGPAASQKKITSPITSPRFSDSMKQVLALLWQHAAVRSLEIARCQRR